MASSRRAPALSRLPVLDEDENVRTVIETPKGSRAKLAFDEKLEAFVVKKVLPEGMSFPFDFGFIPSTLGGDGDPLDVLVLMDEPAMAGVVVPSRLVGVIEARQTERDGKSEDNDRLIAVASVSNLFRDVKTLKDLPDAVIDQIEHFFVSYNEQAGKQFEPVGRHGPKRARHILDDAVRRHGARRRSS
jgi:inorganic pyrophosphatase